MSGGSRPALNLDTHTRSAELVRTINRLRVPGVVHANPLADLDRDQLEGLVIGLAVMLGGIRTPSGVSGLRAPRVHPRRDFWEPDGTFGRETARGNGACEMNQPLRFTAFGCHSQGFLVRGLARI